MRCGAGHSDVVAGYTASLDVGWGCYAGTCKPGMQGMGLLGGWHEGHVGGLLLRHTSEIGTSCVVGTQRHGTVGGRSRAMCVFTEVGAWAGCRSMCGAWGSWVSVCRGLGVQRWLSGNGTISFLQSLPQQTQILLIYFCFCLSPVHPFQWKMFPSFC